MLRWLPRPTIGPLAARRSRALGRRAAPDALALLGAAPQAGWRVGEPLQGRGYASVFAVHHGDDSPALLKATDTERGHAELQREVDALAALHADARLDGWADLVPRTLAVGDVDDVHFVLETRLPGSDVRALPPGAERDRMVHRALDAIVDLQSRTATVAPIGDDDIDRWVHDPAQHVRAVLPGRTRPALDRVEGELVGALHHRRVARGWVHGDFNAANVLAAGGRISGIVDWDTADPDSPVVVDPAMMLLWQNDAHGPELGHRVLHGLASPGELAEVIADVQRRRGGEALDVRTALLLVWLRHVGANLAENADYAANPVWMHRNVRAVLRRL
jgi:aminoglycoside phosphotransferase (APT) family kinase protein